jgi:hypothetical protein
MRKNEVCVSTKETTLNHIDIDPGWSIYASIYTYIYIFRSTSVSTEASLRVARIRIVASFQKRYPNLTFAGIKPIV